VAGTLCVPAAILCRDNPDLLPDNRCAFRIEAMDGAAAVFTGLLTLLNAPFDWVSLELTRVLLLPLAPIEGRCGGVMPLGRAL
jgi:hypothetical protein